MTFDITIPVLNEEATLAQNVKTLHTFVKQHFPATNQWRIVIADNGSTDRTLEIAQELDSRRYNAFEKDLNALIRKHYPEWGCKEI